MTDTCGQMDKTGRYRCNLAPHDPDTYHRSGRGESVRYWLARQDDDE